MSSARKRFAAVFLGILAVIAGQLTLAGPQKPKYTSQKIYTDYGLMSEAPAPSLNMRSLKTEVPLGFSASRLRKSSLLFQLAGGVMFDATATPCNQARGKELKLAYDASRRDGHRLLLYSGGKSYTIPEIYDYELRPIAEFAGGSNPVVVNLQVPEKEQESCPAPTGVRTVMLHPAFLDNRLGWLLIRADAITWDFLEGVQWFSGKPIPDEAKAIAVQVNQEYFADYDTYDDAKRSDGVALFQSGRTALVRMGRQERRELTREVSSIGKLYNWREYEQEFRAGYMISQSDWNKFSVQERRLLIAKAEREQQVSNINDVTAPSGFCIDGEQVLLDGDPHIEILASLADTSHVMQRSTSALTKHQNAVRLADTEAFDAMLRVYRLGGLFRYFKAQSPALWDPFVASLPKREPGEESPRIVCPECEREAVTEWLDCVIRRENTRTLAKPQVRRARNQ